MATRCTGKPFPTTWASIGLPAGYSDLSFGVRTCEARLFPVSNCSSVVGTSDPPSAFPDSQFVFFIISSGNVPGSSTHDFDPVKKSDHTTSAVGGDVKLVDAFTQTELEEVLLLDEDVVQQPPEEAPREDSAWEVDLDADVPTECRCRVHEKTITAVARRIAVRANLSAASTNIMPEELRHLSPSRVLPACLFGDL
ncbi:hypothetical protein PHET_10807 [Paragonimus heterotremus]|uniref:Uncharacterized protein n=1 Tax=Paragonimus heterotremus TaxID=100268 RepID=A0A8J4WCJ6_9TREM|nr:hypothetical protein PHET_10807 [Paragonimus heterotremus]